MFTLLALGWEHYAFTIPLSLLSVFLMMVILVQRGRGGGLTGALGGMGGQSAFGTKAGDLFTRITVGVAAVWILLSMAALKILNKTGTMVAAPPPAATAPATPGTTTPAIPGTTPEKSSSTTDASDKSKAKVKAPAETTPPESAPPASPPEPASTTPSPEGAPTSPATTPPAAEGTPKAADSATPPPE